MSEQWRGLHNPERHEPDMLGVIARCATCGDTGGLCHPDSPCRCCLAAEVEALRARLRAVRDWCGRGQYPVGPVTDWQRGFLTARREIRDILDGGDA